MSALRTIRNLDYTVLFVRDMPRMRHFYEETLQLPLHRTLGPQWIEYRLADTTLALTERGMMFDDPASAPGTLRVQLAFRVAPDDVARCEAELQALGVVIERPTTDQPWGHRTLFVRDPDGNVVEFYADL